MVNLDQLTDIMNCAYASKEQLERKAKAKGKPVQIVLHWTAGSYSATFNSYHINILKDGTPILTTKNFADVLSHNYMKNTGSIGITLCCCYNAGYGKHYVDLGPNPPTPDQIESMCQIVAVLSEALGLEIDKRWVCTHGESADNEDFEFYYPEYTGYKNNTYGPKSNCERSDLEVLLYDRSQKYDPWDEENRGGTVIREKALAYRKKFYGH